MTEEPVAARKPRSMSTALLLYTALRFGVFALCFFAAAAIVLPSTSGSSGPRLIICALIAAIVSVPVSLYAGRKLRADIALGMESQRQTRLEKDREYDARVRAGRRNASGT